jgi:nucleotide-binding universal stress UspA family protein
VRVKRIAFFLNLNSPLRLDKSQGRRWLVRHTDVNASKRRYFMSKNILIAFDDSESARRTVNAVAETFTRASRITLFSVAMDTEAMCKMISPELTPYFKAQQSAFCSMTDKKRELVDTALEQAKEILLEKGFQEENINIKHEDLKEGVASDIISEAEDGYDVVVISRGGSSGIRNFFFGSTSQKVLSAARNVSVFVIN